MTPGRSEHKQKRGPLLGRIDPYIVAISFPLALLWASVPGDAMAAAGFGAASGRWEPGIQRFANVSEFGLAFSSYYAPLGLLVLAAIAANQIVGGSPRTRRAIAVTYAAPGAVLVGAVMGALAIMPI